jgi:hypothetical protein
MKQNTCNLIRDRVPRSWDIRQTTYGHLFKLRPVTRFCVQASICFRGRGDLNEAQEAPARRRALTPAHWDRHSLAWRRPRGTSRGQERRSERGGRVESALIAHHRQRAEAPRSDESSGTTPECSRCRRHPNPLATNSASAPPSLPAFGNRTPQSWEIDIS